jgi:16S rRNA (cytosine1402-N4)-methyltransferase
MIDFAQHYPVLYKPLLDILSVKKNDIILDCTLGRGGHASIFIDKLGINGRYIGLDVDSDAVSYCCEKFGLNKKDFERTDGILCSLNFVKANFLNAKEILQTFDLLNRGVDILLADLGFFFFFEKRLAC